MERSKSSQDGMSLLLHNRSTSHAFDTARSFRSTYQSFLTSPEPSLLHTSASWRTITSLLRSMLFALIPSFVQSWLRGSSKPEQLHPTAYLDGIRGLAAFAVFICHMSYSCFFITYGFGQGEPGENTWPLQLPFIRLAYSGPPMVALFFVISGYALSFKPVRQMRAHQFEPLMTTMSSSVFRRFFRLHLPCFVSTFLVGVMAQLNWFEWTARFSQNKELLRSQDESHAWTAPSPVAQFWDWFHKMFDFVHPWDWMIFGGSLDYDRHLWTIPTEFRASMVLFLTLVMVARLRPRMRMATFVALIYWAMNWNRWEMMLFWSGPVLAELDLMRHERKAARLSEKVPAGISLRKVKLWNWFWTFNFVLSLYLASYPDSEGADTPGYRYISTWIPSHFEDKYRFWHIFAAMNLIWTVNNADHLKTLFTGPVVQYLGKISFALYLMHGPVIHTFGYAVRFFYFSLV